MKFDDASWHYGGDFPKDLPDEAGATHIGMFVAWGLLNGFAGELYHDDFPEDLERLRIREVTPGQFLIEYSDGKFTDEDLNDEGNMFAEAYFKGTYLTDYESTLCANLPTCYHAPDTWENYEKISPVIAKRFSEWKSGDLPSGEKDNLPVASSENKPWWKFW